MSQIRNPAFAGLFYPADPRELRTLLDTLLASASAEDSAPKALIVPHAGYVYSGSVAASGYTLLRSAAARIRRVVLLGPSHRVALRGMALSGAAFFATPLGRVALDPDLHRLARAVPEVSVRDAAHAEEHSLEVHLPFLQCVLAQFSLLPVVVGEAAPAAVAALLDAVWGGAETLIVVSSDLSHYHDYRRARAIDAQTVAAIERFDTAVAPEQACGCRPLNGLLSAARRRGLSLRTLDVRNSGDTAGPRDRVVGYASFALSG